MDAKKMMGNEVVVREFPPLGKYRVRLIESKKGGRALDIREYLSSETFEGYTRRGVRLSDPALVEQLRYILINDDEIQNWVDKEVRKEK